MNTFTSLILGCLIGLISALLFTEYINTSEDSIGLTNEAQIESRAKLNQLHEDLHMRNRTIDSLKTQKSKIKTVYREQIKTVFEILHDTIALSESVNVVLHRLDSMERAGYFAKIEE
jgi:hypothetical protein